MIAGRQHYASAAGSKSGVSRELRSVHRVSSDGELQSAEQAEYSVLGSPQRSKLSGTTHATPSRTVPMYLVPQLSSKLLLHGPPSGAGVAGLAGAGGSLRAQVAVEESSRARSVTCGL